MVSGGLSSGSSRGNALAGSPALFGSEPPLASVESPGVAVRSVPPNANEPGISAEQSAAKFVSMPALVPAETETQSRLLFDEGTGWNVVVTLSFCSQAARRITVQIAFHCYRACSKPQKYSKTKWIKAVAHICR
jgi:hypothetical protein